MINKFSAPDLWMDIETNISVANQKSKLTICVIICDSEEKVFFRAVITRDSIYIMILINKIKLFQNSFSFIFYKAFLKK